MNLYSHKKELEQIPNNVIQFIKVFVKQGFKTTIWKLLIGLSLARLPLVNAPPSSKRPPLVNASF